MCCDNIGICHDSIWVEYLDTLEPCLLWRLLDPRGEFWQKRGWLMLDSFDSETKMFYEGFHFGADFFYIIKILQPTG